MSVANVVNISEVLNLTSPLTFDQVEALRNAITSSQASDLRQGYTELCQKIEAGGGSEPVYARAGLAAFMLAKHEQADEMLKNVSTDGVALFFHAQSLTSLNRHTDAAQRFEEAGNNGYDKIDATLRQAGAIRAGGDVDAAEQMLRSVAASAASRAEYSFQMGCIWADRGDALTAVEYFERAVDMDPHITHELSSGSPPKIHFAVTTKKPFDTTNAVFPNRQYFIGALAEPRTAVRRSRKLSVSGILL